MWAAKVFPASGDMASNPLRGVLQNLRHSARLHEGVERTDSQLRDAFLRSRDPLELEVLVRRHGPMVWGVCGRTLAVEWAKVVGRSLRQAGAFEWRIPEPTSACSRANISARATSALAGTVGTKVRGKLAAAACSVPRASLFTVLCSGRDGRGVSFLTCHTLCRLAGRTLERFLLGWYAGGIPCSR
jgi:hypothetical protein